MGFPTDHTHTRTHPSDGKGDLRNQSITTASECCGKAQEGKIGFPFHMGWGKPKSNETPSCFGVCWGLQNANCLNWQRKRTVCCTCTARGSTGFLCAINLFFLPTQSSPKSIIRNHRSFGQSKQRVFRHPSGGEVIDWEGYMCCMCDGPKQ